MTRSKEHAAHNDEPVKPLNEMPPPGSEDLRRITIRLNIASAGNGLPSRTLEELTAIARRGTPVDIYTEAGGVDRPVGRALRYEMSGDDLWAICDLDVGAQRARAAAVLARQPDGILKLAAVWLTDLERPMIETVGAGLTYPEAQQYALGRSAWKRRGTS
jgi:hypothetical protein